MYVFKKCSPIKHRILNLNCMC